jgi:hypothetical protein
MQKDFWNWTVKICVHQVGYEVKSRQHIAHSHIYVPISLFRDVIFHLKRCF